MSVKLWFTIGASQGDGRIKMKAALKRGAAVAAPVLTSAGVIIPAEAYGGIVTSEARDAADIHTIANLLSTVHAHVGKSDPARDSAGYNSVGLFNVAR